MKTIKLKLKGKTFSIDYNLTTDGKRITIKIEGLDSQLGLGKGFELSVWDSNNIIEIPAFNEKETDDNKAEIIKAILNAENMNYE